MDNIMPDPIRILIVDDHAVVRKGLAMVLRLEPGFEVVGEAENGRLGLEAAKKLQPDIALVDLIMPEMDGQEMALALRKSNPGIKIMMLTGTEVDRQLQHDRIQPREPVRSRGGAPVPSSSLPWQNVQFDRHSGSTVAWHESHEGPAPPRSSSPSVLPWHMRQSCAKNLSSRPWTPGAA